MNNEDQLHLVGVFVHGAKAGGLPGLPTRASRLPFQHGGLGVIGLLR